MLGIICYGDANVFIAEGIGQLDCIFPAFGRVGGGGELYGVSVAEGVAEAGAVQGHGWALVNGWVLVCGPFGKPGAFAAQVPLLQGGAMFLLRVVALACVGCR